MTKTVISAVALGIILLSSALAQQTTASSSVASDQDIQLLRKDLQSERKQVVAANMVLTDVEAQKFWPVYDAYTAEVVKINDLKLAVIKDYADNYDKLTDAKAESLVQKWTEADQSALQLRMKYFPKLQQALSGKQAARFFQIDRRIGVLMDLQLVSQIPMIEP